MAWMRRAKFTVVLLVFGPCVCRCAPQQASPLVAYFQPQCQASYSGLPSTTQVAQCGADVVSGMSITSPVNFKINPQQLAVGQAQILDAPKTTVWLAPKPALPTEVGVPQRPQQQQQEQRQQTQNTSVAASTVPTETAGLPSGVLSNTWPQTQTQVSSDFTSIGTLPIGFNATTPVTFTVPSGSVVSISWILQQTSPRKLLQPRPPPQQQVQAAQNIPRSYGTGLPFCPLHAVIPQQAVGQPGQSQQGASATPQAGASLLAFPSKIFNPASVFLVDEQGRVITATSQLAWHMAQPPALELQQPSARPPARGAAQVYLSDSLPSGVYAFLVTGEVQNMQQIATAPGQVLSIPTLYGRGPACSFLTHPFRVTDIPVARQTATPKGPRATPM